MPGARSRINPASAGENTASDEERHLKVLLQRKLEEDVARIFDESIYCDLEVVCGKLKILTHSCILKTRTHQFYHKLKNILHENIGRKTFEEIYSFISDAYIECDIEHQESDILTYLNAIFNLNQSEENTLCSSKDDTECSFFEPSCTSTPYANATLNETKSPNSTIELRKEYYSLVPINANLLEKELIEQDALSDAFLSIIKTQSGDTVETKQPNKPTSLSFSSPSSKTVKHSNSCDILTTYHVKDTSELEADNESYYNLFTSHDSKLYGTVSSDPADLNFKRSNLNEINTSKLELTYSPDSLITDESSTSTDFLTPEHTYSPGAGSSGCLTQLNGGENSFKMDKIFTISDSGLESNEMKESIVSHEDVTLADITLTESTIYDLTIDETNNSNESTQSPLGDKREFHKIKLPDSPQMASPSGMSTEIEYNEPNTSTPIIFKEIVSGKSSKEEKQRQNEEIVTLESSSLSSETGSWESVFPPKPIEKNSEETMNRESKTPSKDILIENENQSVPFSDVSTTPSSNQPCSSLVLKPIKSSACFIDAASLVEEDDILPQKQTETRECNLDKLPVPSRPVPCSTIKADISPNDWSESNDNEDSLEQADNKDPDSIQKDLSPTIFEMTLVTEDPLCANTFENNACVAESTSKMDKASSDTEGPFSVGFFPMSTPNNSIMSLKSSSFNKQYDSVGSENDTIFRNNERHETLEPLNISCTDSITIKRNLEDIPIVSGAYVPNKEKNLVKHQGKPAKTPCAPSWVVDMSSGPKSDSCASSSHVASKKAEDKVCASLKTTSRYSSSADVQCNKSRSSIDSDSSERSSHKFYIDLSSLPDPLPPEKNKEPESTNEKKNIFTMYIDLGEKPTLKEMPARLSSLSSKRNTSVDISKSTPKSHVVKTPISGRNISNIGGNSLYAFEKLESLCNDPNISISEIVKIPEKSTSSGTAVVTGSEISEGDKLKEGSGNHIVSCSASTAIKEEATGKSVNEPTDLFVKLSDLDKPISKVSDLGRIARPSPSSIKKKENKVYDVRMTRSIPDNNWGEKSFSANSRSVDIISSFHSENTLSLNRLFPHLKNEFSRSVPGSLSRSPLKLAISSSTADVDEQVSDQSELSSVQSSICRSVIDPSTTEETSQISSLVGSCQSRLGQDLLRMFLEEIAPDVIVEVAGRRIKAHKCILSSRCQFFAGILSGGWVESAGNVISLPPFSYNVVHFAMCHIYSGLSVIPETIGIIELATLADMLSLEGLKEAIMLTLKTKYCHHFHRPCPVCIAGVLECFPMSSVYGLDDLFLKCLKWITKHFIKVWPTKAFATLPWELLELCYYQHILHLTTENFVELVYGCGIILESLQDSRWAETIARMCQRAVHDAAQFVASRLVAVFRAVATLPAEAPAPATEAFNYCVTAAIEWATPDEACRAYAFLSEITKEMKSQDAKPDLITNQTNKVASTNNLLVAHAAGWLLQAENALVNATPRHKGLPALQELSLDLQKRLRERGCIIFGVQPSRAKSPSLQNKKNRNPYCNKPARPRTTSTTRNIDIDHVRASFVPYAPAPVRHVTHVSSVDIMRSNNDLKETKKTSRAKPPKVRTTKAQEERAKFNLYKNNQAQNSLTGKPAVPRLHSYENTKPRYLEPTQCKDNERKSCAPNKLAAKMMSSSESSRNSSPIQARNLRTGRVTSRPPFEIKPKDMSQDSLATLSRPPTAEHSVDSLSESQKNNIYATYTKSKHAVKGSVESIKMSKANAVAQSKNQPSKMKTKIPVYLNQNVKSHSAENKNSSESPKRSIQSTSSGSVMSQSRTKTEDKRTGSLMNATKSSSAKMVPKVMKDSPTKKLIKTRSSPSTKQPDKQDDEAPMMARSGTFLKDEATFGDKTTNMDIGQ